MSTGEISATDPYPRKRAEVLGTSMAYVDTGHAGDGRDTIVLIHGNPTSSYLWRNVIPRLASHARCVAPDLVGMGASGRTVSETYRFADHAVHLDALLAAAAPNGRVTLVVHDWGSALGFEWARRHSDRVRGIAYMEAIVRPLKWSEWPDAARDLFKTLRSPAGEDLILNRNVFVERILPGSIIRKLSAEEMDNYRKPFAEAGESRRPTLTWPREIPIDGDPDDVVAVVQGYADWLAASTIPKLFINADPGAILTGVQRDFCRGWPNQREVTVKGIHFVQEDSPHEIGSAIANWYGSLR